MKQLAQFGGLLLLVFAFACSKDSVNSAGNSGGNSGDKNG